jgi:hypothetical protein
LELAETEEEQVAEIRPEPAVPAEMGATRVEPAEVEAQQRRQRRARGPAELGQTGKPSSSRIGKRMNESISSSRSPAISYDGRNIARLWLSEEARVSLGGVINPIAPGSQNISEIVTSFGWFLIIGNSGAQRWLNAEVVVAFEFIEKPGMEFE